MAMLGYTCGLMNIATKEVYSDSINSTVYRLIQHIITIVSGLTHLLKAYYLLQITFISF